MNTTCGGDVARGRQPLSPVFQQTARLEITRLQKVIDERARVVMRRYVDFVIVRPKDPPPVEKDRAQPVRSTFESWEIEGKSGGCSPLDRQQNRQRHIMEQRKMDVAVTAVIEGMAFKPRDILTLLLQLPKMLPKRVEQLAVLILVGSIDS